MADIPAAVYILTTVVLLAFAETWTSVRTLMLILSGLSAGLAAWTKNEGLPLIGIVFVTHAVMIAIGRSWRRYLKEVSAIGAGIAPMFILVVSFKSYLAPPGDIQIDAAAI